jgi:hypothetical protein
MYGTDEAASYIKTIQKVLFEKRTVKITGLRRAKGTECWKRCVMGIKVHTITCLEGTEGEQRYSYALS